MTWGLASFVASGLATVIGFRASIASRRSRATFGPVTPIFRTQRKGGPSTSDFAALIARRGQRLHNRSKDASIYERANMALFREVFHGRR